MSREANRTEMHVSCALDARIGGWFRALLVAALLPLPLSAAHPTGQHTKSGKAEQQQGAANPQTHIIVIKQMHFEPAQTTIEPGDTVEWDNQDIFAHTATADDGSFGSPLIAPGKSWSTKIEKAGTLTYHCTPHPNMRAQLTLTPQASASHAGGVEGRGGDGGEQAHPASLRWRPPTRPEEIHPILVNFTAALIPLAFLSDLLGRLKRKDSLLNAGFWMIVYAALLTPLTAAAGWWWKRAETVQLPAKLIVVHQWLGTTAALLLIVLVLWRWSAYRQRSAPSVAYLIVLFLAVLAVVYQGSLGGAMMFGQ